MRILFFLLGVLTLQNVIAQEGLEWEVASLGSNFLAFKKSRNEKMVSGGEIATELRHNFEDGEYDMGAQIMFSSYNRDNPYPYSNYKNQFSIFQLFMDKNINPEWKAMPFIGLGIGTTTIIDSESDLDNKQMIKTLMVTPRVGMEFFRFLRATLEYHLTNYPYSHFAFRVGLIFGGRVPKSQKFK